jgi:glycosyltransferase involved in cell wall biosynthesis
MLPCFGCGYHECFLGEARCLADITPAAVADAVGEALADAPFRTVVAEAPLDAAMLTRAAERFVARANLPRVADNGHSEVAALLDALEDLRGRNAAILEDLRTNAFAWLLALETRPQAPFGFLHPQQADLVSVVIPAYDAARFLERAVASVWNQERAGFDVEILLVDDGSADGTLALAHDLAGRSPVPMSVLSHPGGANRGVSAARNLGLRHARGGFIALLDADDAYLPPRLRRGVDHLRRHPAAMCVASYGANRDAAGRLAVGWAGSTVAGRYADTGQPTDFRPPYTFEQLLRGDPVVNSTLLIRRAALDAVGGYPEVMAHQAEDWFLLAKLSLLAPIELIPEMLIDYLVHPDSYTTRYFTEGLAYGVRLEFLCHLVHWMIQQPAHRERGIAAFRKSFPALVAGRSHAYRLIEELQLKHGEAPLDVNAFEQHLAGVYGELETLRHQRAELEAVARLLRPFPSAKRLLRATLHATTNAFKRRPAP